VGITHVDAEVSGEGGVPRTVRFLVASGAGFTVSPLETWRALERTLRPARLRLAAVAPGGAVA